MAYKYYFLLCLLFTISNITSQKKTAPTEQDILVAKKLGKIYPDDDIVITNYSEIIDFDYDKKTKKVTVKNKSQQEYINLKSRTEIPLVIGYDNQSKVFGINVNYRNGKEANIYFKDEYYNQEELFHSDARIKWTGLNFPMMGYKYTFEYKKKYKDVKYFISTYLDSHFPILQKTITINVPKWLEIEIKEINLDGFSVKKEELLIENQNITQYIYSIEKTNAVKKEENSLGPTHYRPHLLFLAKSHKKNETTEVLINNTKDLYKWYYTLVSQLNNDNESLVQKTLSIIQNQSTDEDKMRAIYYWVQDNIRYIAFEDGIAGFKPEEAIDVYRKKYGDCKGMANLTKQMMKIAGFDARLSWIGTRRIAYDYSIPTIAVDNHMICTVIAGNQRYFLDATEKFNPLGTYAERIQKKQVLIENNEDYLLDTIPSRLSKYNQETSIFSLLIENEKLKGKVKRVYEGESKTNFLYNINSLKKDRKSEALEFYVTHGDKNLVLNDISVTDISDRDGNLELSYDIILNNAISSFENELYIDVDYYKDYQQLDLDKRKTSFVFPYKVYENTFTTIEIPNGYVIKKLPDNLSIKTKDFEISFTYTSDKNKIIYKKNINFKNAIIQTSELSSWKKFHNQLKKQYQQQIILAKK